MQLFLSNYSNIMKTSRQLFLEMNSLINYKNNNELF